MRRRSIAADGFGTTDEPRIHGDRGAIVSEVGLVVLVDEMLVEEAHIPIGELFAEHLFDALGEETAVETDESLLRQLTDKSSDVLMLHIRVRIKFRSLRRIGSLHIVHHEIETTLRVAVLGVLMAIKHICFSHLIITLRHKRDLHLVLDILNAHDVMNPQMRKERSQRFLRRKCTNC